MFACSLAAKGRIDWGISATGQSYVGKLPVLAYGSLQLSVVIEPPWQDPPKPITLRSLTYLLLAFMYFISATVRAVSLADVYDPSDKWT